MSGGRFDYNQYRIREIAEAIKEEFEIRRDRRLVAVHTDLHGRRRETRRGCKPKTLRVLREAYIALRIAEIYAQRIDWWLSDDDGEETLHARLHAELNEFRKERLSLRRKKPDGEEIPEDDSYRELAKGVWASETKGPTDEILDKLRSGYHEQSGRKHRRGCLNCVFYMQRYMRCDIIHGFVSSSGLCRHWTDPKSSVCRSCVHGGEFDGRSTHCLLKDTHAFLDECSDYEAKNGGRQLKATKVGR